jgi:MFS family permease
MDYKMMMLVPMYFQVSAHATVTNAGAHLMPSVIGNAMGGLLTGLIIRRLYYFPLISTLGTNKYYRTGRYKSISILGAFSAIMSYLLMILRWHGHTSLLESLYIIPGGFGNGIALSASFIGLTAGVDPCQVAIASSGLFLSSNIGMVGGLSIAGAILQTSLRKELGIALEGIDDRAEVKKRGTASVQTQLVNIQTDTRPRFIRY